MDLGGPLWAAGGYLVGTFPSTLLAARAGKAPHVERASGRRAGETDAHLMVARTMGMRWAASAATVDVLKALGFVLAARHAGGLGPGWLAVAGPAVVVGHAFPFYGRSMAGRGLAAAAGVLLVLLPVEMTVAGVAILVGVLLRSSGLASTIGLAAVPPMAAVQGQPGAFVAMSGAILAVVLARRLEGVGDVARTGIGLRRAVLYRCLFDSSGTPPRAGAVER